MPQDSKLLGRRGNGHSYLVGIGGWSNGAFMTEFAITHTTRFKAAVAVAGHSDFFSLYGTSYLRAGLRISAPDSPYYNRQWYDDRSPITSIRNCRNGNAVGPWDWG